MIRTQGPQGQTFERAEVEARSWAPKDSNPQRMPRRLPAQADRLRRWLFGKALPLWASAGLDLAGGGFQEALSQSAEPVQLPRRARVQARQAYVFATAGLLGWTGPWRDAAQRGLEQLNRKYRRPDGLFRTLVSPDGVALDDTAHLYDQAFVLLAQARLCAAGVEAGEMESAAVALRTALSAFRHEGGGFREASERPFQANAHMHLLEAAMEWATVRPDPAWRALGEEIVELALTRFIDGRHGRLLEVFDARWRPAPGELGRVTEPGHQFEWAWLLRRWGMRSQDVRALRAAQALRLSGEAGVDPDRGVAVDEVAIDGRPHRPTARLWPQTEWLKAALDAGLDDGDWALAEEACEALMRYLDTPVGGLWRDRMLEDGQMVDEPAPASSFYHIVTACSELFAVVAAETLSTEEAAELETARVSRAAHAPGPEGTRA